jgi:hypothetical protein
MRVVRRAGGESMRSAGCLSHCRRRDGGTAVAAMKK